MSKKDKKKSWSSMSGGRKAMTMVMGAAQVALAVTAWKDLAKRPADQVNGPKAAWAAAIAVNFIGPILYFTKGRVK